MDYEGSDGRAVLEHAWGSADADPDRDDQNHSVWRNAKTGWRATVFCGHGTETTPLPPFCTIDFFPHKPLEAMFTHAIRPPDELGAASWGMTRKQLEAATHVTLDDLEASHRHLAYDGAVESVSLSGDRLYQVSYRLPPVARGMIEKAWGSGEVVDDDTMVWVDADTGWSATTRKPGADSVWLDFHGYMPFDKLIDLLDGMTAAKSIDDARAAHPELRWDTKRRHAAVDFPFNEMMTGLQLEIVSVGVWPGKQGAPEFYLNELRASKRDAIVADFTRRWGAPKLTVETLENDTTTYQRWPKHAELRTIHSDHDDTVTAIIGAGVTTGK